MPRGGSDPCVAGCGCGRHVKPKGQDSPNWVGGEVTHKAMHPRVIRVRGAARTHRCLFCAERDLDKPALDWAQLPGTSGLGIADYVPLCRKCHINLDDSAGARWHPAHRAAVSLAAENRRRRCSTGCGTGLDHRNRTGLCRSCWLKAPATR